MDQVAFTNSVICAPCEWEGHENEWQRTILVLMGTLGSVNVGSSLGQDWRTVVTAYWKSVVVI